MLSSLVKIRTGLPKLSSHSAAIINKLENGLNWLIPFPCMACYRPTDIPDICYCSDCYQNLPFLSNHCHVCSQQLIVGQDFCGRCILRPPNFDESFCAFEYASPIREAISKLKYQDSPETARHLGRLFADQIRQAELEMPELLVPVPIHINRLRSRGYNQSLLLTKELSKSLDIPLSNKLISKVVDTPPQASLTKKERKKNLRESFKLNQVIKHKNIAIIDDVYTTGATATEITKILKRNGVDYVQVWGLAHAI